MEQLDRLQPPNHSHSIAKLANWLQLEKFEMMGEEFCECCDSRFGLLRRKRQCFYCSKSICSRCSSKRKELGKKDSQVVCKVCETNHKSLLLRQSSSDLGLPDPSSSSVQALSLDSRNNRKRVSLEEGSVTSPLLPQGKEVTACSFDELHFAGVLELELIEARGLLAMDTNLLGMKTSSDPYCIVSIGKWTRTSKVIAKNMNPKWDERFEIELIYPAPVVKFDLFDKDLARKDDFLGCASLDLGGCEPDKHYAGWLELTHPEFSGVGMIHVGVTLRSTAVSEILGYMRETIKANNPDPPPLPRFNINHLYGPWMLLIDIVILRTIVPIVGEIVDIIYWKSQGRTAILLFFWFPLCYYFAYWPSVLCFALAGKMAHCRHKRLHTAFTSSGSAGVLAEMEGCLEKMGTVQCQEDEPNDKMTLGSFVSRATTFMPGWLKLLLASLQISSKDQADTCMLLYDILHWRSMHSPVVFKALVGLGCILVCVPFWLFLYVAGVGLLLLFSPALAFISGCVRHVRHPPRTGVPALLADFDLARASNDSRRLSKALRTNPH